MKGKIEKVKKLKYILLVYEDGRVLKVPEVKTLKVGTAFMKVVSKENIQWEIIKGIESSWTDKIKKFFEI